MKSASACQQRAALLNDILPLYGVLSLKIYGNLEARRPEVFDDLSSQLEDLFTRVFSPIWNREGCNTTHVI